MINIKGNYAEAIVYTDALDNAANGLIKALCDSVLAENSKIRIMPDVHPGRGCVVGLTMTLNNYVAPGLVGVDIGCGMEVVKIKAKKLELQQLDKIVHSKIPSGYSLRSTPHRFCENIDLSELKCAKNIQMNKAVLSIGTLGGGNHFIELDKADDGYYIVIHSGSRHLGVDVEQHYHTLAHKNSNGKVPYELAYLEGEQAEDYLHDIAIVQKYADINRKAIADEIIRNMKLSKIESFSTIHNYIDTENGILRKGSIFALKGQKFIIPLNMRDGCLICTGKGNPDWNSSAPHGAGRAFTRKDTLGLFTLTQYKKEMQGIYSTSVNKDTIDECPMAYKNSQSIKDAISETAEIVEPVSPVYNFKAGSK